MADVTITRELGPKKGRYVAKFPDFDGEAVLTFVLLDDGRVLAEHTLTPVPLRGRGIASAPAFDDTKSGMTDIPDRPF